MARILPQNERVLLARYRVTIFSCSILRFYSLYVVNIYGRVTYTVVGFRYGLHMNQHRADIRHNIKKSMEARLFFCKLH